VQDLALGLVESHTVGLGPSIQSVQIPLQSLPTLQEIDTPTQLGVICKLTEGALNPLIQIIDKYALTKVQDPAFGLVETLTWLMS